MKYSILSLFVLVLIGCEARFQCESNPSEKKNSVVEVETVSWTEPSRIKNVILQEEAGGFNLFITFVDASGKYTTASGKLMVNVGLDLYQMADVALRNYARQTVKISSDNFTDIFIQDGHLQYKAVGIQIFLSDSTLNESFGPTRNPVIYYQIEFEAHDGKFMEVKSSSFYRGTHRAG